MPQVGQIGGANFVALDRDFGDKPLGKMGGRTVQAQDAPNARGGGQAQGPSKAKRLFDRVADALTPPSVRAEGKFRRGLEATSKTTGNILGALASGDGNAVKKGMASLRHDAAPVTSRGKSFDEVLTARLDVHVNKMSTVELVKVAQGAGKGATLPEAQAADFTKIANHVQTAARDRLVETAVADTKQSILDSLGGGTKPPANPSAQTGYTAGPAEVHGNAIASSGLWPKETLDDPKAGLVKAALTEVTADQRQAFLATMSYDELQALRANGDDFGRGAGMDAVDLDIEIAIANARDLKRDNLLMKLENLAQKLPGLGSDPGELKTLLKAMDTDLSQYRAMNEDVTDIDGAFGKMLGKLYETSLDRDKLQAMPDQDFVELKDLLRTHAGDYAKDRIDAEVTTRRTKITDGVAAGLKNAFDKLEAGDTVGFLKAFAKNLADQEIGLQKSSALLGKDVGGDDRQAFRQNVVNAFLNGNNITGDALTGLDRQLKSDDLAPIFEWLGDAGATPRYASTETAQVALQLYSTFKTLTSEVASRVAQATGEQPQGYAFDPNAQLSDKARHGLAAMGVRVENGNGVIATATGGAGNDRAEAARYQQDLATLMRNEAGSVRDDVPLADVFVRDIVRNGRIDGAVMIDFGDGREELVPGHKKSTDHNSNDEVTRTAGERLLELFDDDEEMVANVSAIMHQGMIAYMGTSATRPDTNPIRNGNGEAVGFLGKIAEQNSMSVSRDGDGSARISMTYHTEPQFLVVNGEQTLNDKGTNASWDVEVLIRPGGTVEVDRFSRSHNVF